MYGSGIRALDDLAGELDKNSEYTFGRLNSQVLNHSSALEDVSKLFLWLCKLSEIYLTKVLICIHTFMFM